MKQYLQNRTTTPVFGMMVIPITVEITVKEKTKLVMEFAAMAGFHVEISHRNLIMIHITTSHSASRMTAAMDTTLEIVMANAFILKSHVMVSVKKAGQTAMVTVETICGINATIPALKAGRGVGITGALGMILRMLLIGPVETDAMKKGSLVTMFVLMVGCLVGTGQQTTTKPATIHLLASSLAMDNA